MEKEIKEEVEHFGIAAVPIKLKREFHSLRAQAGMKAPEFLEELLRHYNIDHREFKAPGAPQAATTEESTGPTENCLRDIADTLDIFKKGDELKTSRAAEYISTTYLKPGVSHPKADIEAVRAFFNEHRPEKKKEAKKSTTTG